MPKNLWHDILPGQADSINVIVEINKGSKNKYEIDKETGLIALDRTAYTTQDFPFDYGFVPRSLWEDGDPLDVIILTTFPLLPGVLARVRPVGIMNMIDDGEGDSKIICVPINDPRWTGVKDLSDINPHTLKEMEHFYSTYKDLQNKKVEITGFGDKEEAIKAYEQALAAYSEKYSKTTAL